MVKLDTHEAMLTIEGIEAKMREYKDYPTEVQEFFLAPYIKLHHELSEALKAEQEAALKKKK